MGEGEVSRGGSGATVGPFGAAAAPVRPWRQVLTAVTPTAVLATLLCCALPIALVAAGAGAAVASFLSWAPWIADLSRYKAGVFLLAGALLVLNYWALYRSGRACRPGGICHSSHPVGRRLRRVFWGSVALYATALAAAYLSLPLLRLFAR